MRGTFTKTGLLHKLTHRLFNGSLMPATARKELIAKCGFSEIEADAILLADKLAAGLPQGEMARLRKRFCELDEDLEQELHEASFQKAFAGEDGEVPGRTELVRKLTRDGVGMTKLLRLDDTQLAQLASKRGLI
jgi:hypothetical protein